VIDGELPGRNAADRALADCDHTPGGNSNLDRFHGYVTAKESSGRWRLAASRSNRQLGEWVIEEER